MMDWKGVVGPLLQQFAPKLAKGLLGQIPVVGPIAVQFGGAAIDEAIGALLAQVFGVEATPDAVAKAIDDSVPEVVAEKLREAEKLAEGKWPALAAIAAAEADFGKSAMQVVNETIRAEQVNYTAGGDGWLGKWRGFAAWEFFGFECPLFMVTVLYKIWTADSSTDVQSFSQIMAALWTVISFYFGGRFLVCGVHIWKGSDERQVAMVTGTTAPPPEAVKPTTLDDVKALLAKAGVKVK